MPINKTLNQTNRTGLNNGTLNTAAAAAEGGFNMLDLSPTVWIDTTLSDMTVASNLVSQIDDMSGNANHGTQGTGSLQPADNTETINSLAVLGFDGTDDFMEFGSQLSFAGDFTYVVVLRHSAAANQVDGFMGSDTSTNTFIYTQSDTLKYKIGNGTIISTGLSLPVDTDTLVIIRRTGTTIDSEVNGNTHQQTSYNSNADLIDNIGDAGGATPSWEGGIGHYTLIPSYVTGDDYTNLKNYINGIWGV